MPVTPPEVLPPNLLAVVCKEKKERMAENRVDGPPWKLLGRLVIIRKGRCELGKRLRERLEFFEFDYGGSQMGSDGIPHRLGK